MKWRKNIGRLSTESLALSDRNIHISAPANVSGGKVRAGDHHQSWRGDVAEVRHLGADPGRGQPGEGDPSGT